MSVIGINSLDIFNLNPLPSWIFEVGTSQILEVNTAAIEHYGYSKEEFLKLTLFDLRLFEEIPKLLASQKKTHPPFGNIHFGIFTHKKKNGELIKMDIVGQKVTFSSKKAVMVICHDVTKQEQHLRLLKESENRLQSAINIAKLGYYKLDLITNDLTWSDEVFWIWGRKKEEFILTYENFIKTIHPNDLDYFFKEQEKSINGIENHDVVHRILLPDNAVKWVHEMGRL